MDKDQPMSRSDYRKRQAAAERDLADRDKKRLEAEREYAQEHPMEEPAEDEPMTRSRRQDPLNPVEKTTKMKSKLNMVIGGLVIAIVAVYLILFFVG